MTPQTLRPEILVVGAGPGGSAAAWALARAGLDVLVADARAFPRDKTCGDGLTPMAVESLRQMGLLEGVLAAGATRVEDLSLTAPLGVRIRVSFEESMGPGHFALVLPRLTLDHLLVEHACAAGARLLEGRVVEMAWRDDAIAAVRVETPAGDLIVEPGHVVVAVGANIGFLRRHGLLAGKVPVMRAARAYFSDVRPLEMSYGFFFTPRLAPGYGWVFPTGPESANVGVAVSPVYFPSKRSTAALLDGFVGWLKRRGVVASASRESAIKGYPIRTDFPSHRVAGRNWVIVGEATGLVNPITGEGIDLALRSGLLAAEVVRAGLRSGAESHAAYEAALRKDYAGRFLGLRICRNLFMLPIVMDYFVWQMKQHRFIREAVVLITQGYEHPRRVLHPLFVLLMLIPLSPRFVATRLRRLASR